MASVSGQQTRSKHPPCLDRSLSQVLGECKKESYTSSPQVGGQTVTPGTNVEREHLVPEEHGGGVPTPPGCQGAETRMSGANRA